MTNMTNEEFEARPRKRLLGLLKRRKIKLGLFAVVSEMAAHPGDDWQGRLSPEAEHRQRCLAKIRRYTHGVNGRYATPPADVLVRWGRALNVDPGYFYSRGLGKPPEFKESAAERDD